MEKNTFVNAKRFYNDIVKGRRKLKPNVEFKSILSVPIFALARHYNKDDVEYPHTTKCSYETMSNNEGWREI